MKKWPEQQGATFQPGKGSHLKVFLNGKQTTLPMHVTTELGKWLEAAIIELYVIHDVQNPPANVGN
jgi:mRNA interferase HicA